MDKESLKGIKVAILVEDGFEESELTQPRKALEEAGATTLIVSPKPDRVRGWRSGQWGDEIPVDVRIEGARHEDFHALLLPGGVRNPDRLRINDESVAFVKAFFTVGKPVAAICHAPWVIIEAGAAKGKKMTSWPSLKTDLRNAGAEWLDQDVVVDGKLVTSRKPEDIPAFNGAMVLVFASMMPIVHPKEASAPV